jgi:hypothetical protein
MLKGGAWIMKEIPQNKIDRLVNQYYKSKNIALLDKLDEVRKEQRKELGPKLKQGEIDQLIKDMED